MPYTYSITLSDIENKALSYVCVCPQEWIENFIKERCKVAIDEIVNTEVQRMLKDNTINTIPGDKETIVMNASLKY